MDKQTLSNYGWVVICILVLSVMIALATPFGTYVSEGVNSVTQGLFETEGEAVRVAKIATGQICYVPEGGKYVTVSGKEYLPGDEMPALMRNYDKYYYGDYQYWYVSGIEGWRVLLKRECRTQEEFGEILSYINNKPVKSVRQCFFNVETIKRAPQMPITIVDMEQAFENCKALEYCPDIPNSVVNMKQTFQGCSSLTNAPAISQSVENMWCTFYTCTNLKTVPDLSKCANLTTLENTFAYCRNLEDASTLNIPSKVTMMNCAFLHCDALTKAPVIPENVTNIASVYRSCTSLKTAEINTQELQEYKRAIESSRITSITGSCSDAAKTAILATK